MRCRLSALAADPRRRLGRPPRDLGQDGCDGVRRRVDGGSHRAIMLRLEARLGEIAARLGWLAGE
jgi:hypothetical protein